MGEASGWLWEGVGLGQEGLSQGLLLPPRILPETVPCFQGLLPTQQGWDRVLDQEAKSAWTSSWFCQLGKLMSAHQSHSC